LNNGEAILKTTMMLMVVLFMDLNFLLKIGSLLTMYQPRTGNAHSGVDGLFYHIRRCQWRTDRSACGLVWPSLSMAGSCSSPTTTPMWGRSSGIVREFAEETGLQAEITDLLEVSEVLKPEQPWHSVSITFVGKIVGGRANPEVYARHGKRDLQWFSAEELAQVKYHPPAVVEKALGVRVEPAG
jgi:8-oxo-dGTP pyrophosphatase MutT (NUDIX family)